MTTVYLCAVRSTFSKDHKLLPQNTIQDFLIGLPTFLSDQSISELKSKVSMKARGDRDLKFLLQRQ